MKVQGARRLARKIAAMPAAARVEISAALEASANELVALQRAAAPRDEGDLVASVDWNWGGRGIAGELRGDARLSAVITAGGPLTTKPVRNGVDVEYDYALGQEFGTQDMPANPFFFPAYRLIKRRVRARISRAIRKAARKVAGGA